MGLEAVRMRRGQVNYATQNLSARVDDFAIEIALALDAGATRSELCEASGYSRYILPRMIDRGRWLLERRGS